MLTFSFLPLLGRTVYTSDYTCRTKFTQGQIEHMRAQYEVYRKPTCPAPTRAPTRSSTESLSRAPSASPTSSMAPTTETHAPTDQPSTEPSPSPSDEPLFSRAKNLPTCQVAHRPCTPVFIRLCLPAPNPRPRRFRPRASFGSVCVKDNRIAALEIAIHSFGGTSFQACVLFFDRTTHCVCTDVEFVALTRPGRARSSIQCC